MKNLTTYPTHHNSPAPKSRFNQLIDLAPMMALIETIMGLITAQMDNVDTREFYRLFAWKFKEEKQLENAKVHNFKTGLKWNMLRRGKWREKVLDDLGGEAALEKWESRAAKAAARVPSPYKAPVYKRPLLVSLRLGAIKLPPVRTPFDVKTDETGCFRLAPIPNTRAKRPDNFEPEELTYNQKWDRKEGWRLRAQLRAKQYPPEPVDESTLKGYWYKDEAANTIYRITPIPLLPDELRGQWDEEIVEGETQIPTHLGLPDHTDTNNIKALFRDDNAEDTADNLYVDPPP